VFISDILLDRGRLIVLLQDRHTTNASQLGMKATSTLRISKTSGQGVNMKQRYFWRRDMLEAEGLSLSKKEVEALGLWKTVVATTSKAFGMCLLTSFSSTSC